MTLPWVRRQSGVTIPEMGVAVLVAGVLGAAATAGLGHAIRDNTATNVATQVANGYDTLNNYVASHIDALVSGQPVAGVANPFQPTVLELQALGYRSFGTRSFLSPLNYAYSLTLMPAGCVPNTCNIAVYFGLDRAPRDKDGTVDMAMAASIARRIGRPAGFSSLDAPGNIAGLGEAFNIANPTGANPGIVAAYGSYGAGPFGNYVRMGDTRAVSLRGTLALNGKDAAGTSLSTLGDVKAGAKLLSTGGLEVGVERMTIGSNGNVWTSGTLKADGAIEAQGELRAVSGKVWMEPVAVSGRGCNDAIGTISMDRGGSVLSCQRGTWLPAGSKPTFTVVQCGGAIVGCPEGSHELFRFPSAAGLSNCGVQTHTVCQKD